jgi:hypothetical protein
MHCISAVTGRKINTACSAGVPCARFCHSSRNASGVISTSSPSAIEQPRIDNAPVWRARCRAESSMDRTGLRFINCKVPGRSVSRILSGRDSVYVPRDFIPAPCLGDHLSVQSTRDSNGAGRSSSLLDLAPGGGCLAARIAANAGGLLHHLFTIAPTPCTFSQRERDGMEGSLFLWPCQQIAPLRGFPGAAPCRVRTFLDPAQGGTAITRPT